MPEFKVPPHPTHDKRCDACVHWLEGQAKNSVMVMTPQGPQWMPTEDALKKGVPIGEAVTAKLAPCTYSAIWQMVPMVHWCSRYQGKAKY